MLAAIPPFHAWSKAWARVEVGVDTNVDNMVTTLTFPPFAHIWNFQKCMAHGNHFHVAIGDTKHGFTTFDSGIALVAQQGSWPSRAIQNVQEFFYPTCVLAKILQTMFDQTQVILFRGSWTPPNVMGILPLKRENMVCRWMTFNVDRRVKNSLEISLTIGAGVLP